MVIKPEGGKHEDQYCFAQAANRMAAGPYKWSCDHQNPRRKLILL
jgi:hypothetical protein